MDVRSPFVEDMLPAVHSRVFDHWKGLVQDDAVPDRASFDPVALRGDLKHVFLLTVEHTPKHPRFRMRVHGTEVNHIVGRDLSGKFLDEEVDSDSHRRLVRGFLECIDERKPVLEQFDSVFPGRSHIIVTRLSLPLRDEKRGVDSVLGSLAVLDYKR